MKNSPKKAIIVITGLSDKTLSVNAIKAGAQDFMTKGAFDADLLYSSIRHAVSRQTIIRKSNETISEREIEINLLIDITSAIKKDIPIEELLNVFSSSLRWSKISDEMIFLIKDNHEWLTLISYPEDLVQNFESKRFNIDLLNKYTEVNYIDDNDKVEINNFEFAIPIKQHLDVFGLLLLKEIKEAFQFKKKFIVLLTEIIGLAFLTNRIIRLAKRE